jgi:hypothetical protein
LTPIFHHNGDPAFLQKLVVKLDAGDGVAASSHCPKTWTASKPSWQAIAAGFRGLGEMTGPLKNYDDRAYWPIYQRAEKYGMIVLFHTGIVNRQTPSVPSEVSVDRMRPTTLDVIARRFPELTIIGAHLGNPDYAWAAEIARWNPNLYFDLSGSTLIKKQEDYKYFKTLFWLFWWSGVVSPHRPAMGLARSNR